MKTYRMELVINVDAENPHQAEEIVFTRIFYYGVKDCTITKTEEVKHVRN